MTFFDKLDKANSEALVIAATKAMEAINTHVLMDTGSLRDSAHIDPYNPNTGLVPIVWGNEEVDYAAYAYNEDVIHGGSYKPTTEGTTDHWLDGNSLNIGGTVPYSFEDSGDYQVFVDTYEREFTRLLNEG